MSADTKTATTPAPFAAETAPGYTGPAPSDPRRRRQLAKTVVLAPVPAEGFAPIAQSVEK